MKSTLVCQSNNLNSKLTSLNGARLNQLHLSGFIEKFLTCCRNITPKDSCT